MTDVESPEAHPAKSSEEMAAAFFRWGLQHNLNYYIRFHNVLKGYLGELRREPEIKDDSAALETLKLYENLNASNTLLLTLAYLEEMLILFWQRVFPTKPLPSGGKKRRGNRTGKSTCGEKRYGGIDRYKPMFNKLGLNLGTMESWSRLKDATRIRHCLLHTNGRLSLMRHPEKIQAIVDRNEGLEVNLDRVRVTPVFLKSSVDALHQLREVMLEAHDGSK